eukprot:2670309-Prymnesium_polylepis.1
MATGRERAIRERQVSAIEIREGCTCGGRQVSAVEIREGCTCGGRQASAAVTIAAAMILP